MNAIFLAYAARGNFPTLNKFDFQGFSKDAKLPDKKCNKETIDMYFVATNVELED